MQLAAMADGEFFEVPNLVVDEEWSTESDASSEPVVKKGRGKASKYAPWNDSKLFIFVKVQR